MSAPNAISTDKLVRLIGTAKAPLILDVRGETTQADPVGRPDSRRITIRSNPMRLGPGPFVVSCKGGRDTSQGIAAMLRHQGAQAETLEGGIAAWTAAGLPTVEAESCRRATRTAGRSG